VLDVTEAAASSWFDVFIVLETIIILIHTRIVTG
jgi:hypothetical protein